MGSLSADGMMVAAVKGNCDFGSFLPESRIFSLEGLRLLMAHGHTFGVKQGRGALAEYARQNGVDIALYGHTHTAAEENIGGVLLLCPGAMKRSIQSYIVLEVENGEARHYFRYIK